MLPRVSPAPVPRMDTDMFFVFLSWLINFSSPSGMEAAMQLPCMCNVSMMVNGLMLKFL